MNSSFQRPFELPYSTILPSLVRSIIGAQADLSSALNFGLPMREVPHAFINRHFAWLQFAGFERGDYRQFFDALIDLAPLRRQVSREELNSSTLVHKKIQNNEPLLTPFSMCFDLISKLPRSQTTLLEDDEVAKKKALMADLNMVFQSQGHDSEAFDNRIEKIAKNYDGFKLENFYDPFEFGFVQPEQTRISALIRRSVLRFGRHDLQDLDGYLSPDPDKPFLSMPLLLKSPFEIALEFLTVPEWDGSRAYAEFSLRHLLLSTFEVFPDEWRKSPPSHGGEVQNNKNFNGLKSFSVSDLENAMGRVWTSLRQRHDSSGEDKLPSRGKGDDERCDAFVRHYLAAHGVLGHWFKSLGEFHEFATRRTDQLTEVQRLYSFGRTPNLETLPDYSEIVNQIFGLPIPIDGANTLFRGGLRFSARGGLIMALHGEPGTGKTTLALSFARSLAPFGIRTVYFSAEETVGDLEARLSSLSPEDYAGLPFINSPPEDSIRFERFEDDPEEMLEEYLGHLIDEDLQDEEELEYEEELGFESDEADEYGDEDDDQWISELLNIDPIELLEGRIGDLESVLKQSMQSENQTSKEIPKACRAIVVLDGLHDIIQRSGLEENDGSRLTALYRIVHKLRKLPALVIVTTGVDWSDDSRLDYLLDVSMYLKFEALEDQSAKPDRQIILPKARHQLCAIGTHGVHISGARGVRFSPQIAYLLERQAHLKSSLPNRNRYKDVLKRVLVAEHFLLLCEGRQNQSRGLKRETSSRSAEIYEGSHVFINGLGSGGKAALGLKLAISPAKHRTISTGEDGNVSFAEEIIHERQRVLVVSFLYPQEYYDELTRRLLKERQAEYGISTKDLIPRVNVLQLYPGHLQPNDLYNKIIQELDRAELLGEPYQTIVLEGIHNVFLQFPRIEENRLFWPQLYSSLRIRSTTTITTHTNLAMPAQEFESNESFAFRQPQIDDARFEPLKHALVQKTDFHIEVSPLSLKSGPEKSHYPNNGVDLFVVRSISSIGQTSPAGHVLWSRGRLCLGDSIELEHQESRPRQAPLPLDR